MLPKNKCICVKYKFAHKIHCRFFKLIKIVNYIVIVNAYLIMKQMTNCIYLNVKLFNKTVLFQHF